MKATTLDLFQDALDVAPTPALKGEQDMFADLAPAAPVMRVDSEPKPVLDFRSDIPLALAIQAHAGTSFVPEKRGQSILDEYHATLTGDLARLRAKCAPEFLAVLEEEFSRYRQGYKTRYLAWLRSRGGCVSTMIAGPSNFPVRRMEKRFNIADRRATELVEFRERALEAINKTLHPELRPIMAGDSDAVERLKKELVDLEAFQERAKLINATIRKTKGKTHEERVAALVAVGLAQGIAEKALTPDCFGCLGVPGYATKNNGANIRRVKARIEHLEAAKTKPVVEVEGKDGVRIEDDPPANRVRIYFPGKPDDATRDRLKAAGYRWAPSVGAWQAYRNHNGMRLAREFKEATV